MNQATWSCCSRMIELDRRYLGYITDYVDVGVIHHVENSTTAYGYWKKLQGLYERETASHMVGLQHKVAFNKSNSRRTTGILELVYFDVCGPMKVRTLGGCSYFVTFIDDYSRKVWTYAIKTKDQVFDCFIYFHVLVERQTGKSLKCIRTDNGGKYIGIFDQYYKQKGKRHEQSVPKIPQHNGVAERMNRTIIEKVRCMLSHANLPRTFWGEAMIVAVQVINLSPTHVLNGDVPDELWSGKEATYHHLKVFGSISRYEKFGYKLYDPTEKKTLRSIDVKFLEDQNISNIIKNGTAETDLGELVEWESDDEVVTGNNITDNDIDDDQQDVDADIDQQSVQADGQPQATRAYSRIKMSSTRYSPNEIPDKKVLKNKWVYKLKFEEGKTKPRYKARLVVKGFEQKFGVDYDEIFSPVGKMTSIRLIHGLTACLDLKLQQLDVKTTFLHGELDEVIHMEQPEGFVIKGKEKLVCKLNKSLYGLKQTPRQ
ncbi:transmembrane signal receptor [Lithospermum erythrorhizon]|uniref:Transmembrane signal receptor n=1 Tax=Lithospermum erythrorhizon TaxID=34254 RepID=A0AAV3PP64_LITER